MSERLHYSVGGKCGWGTIPRETLYYQLLPPRVIAGGAFAMASCYDHLHHLGEYDAASSKSQDQGEKLVTHV